MPLKQLRVVEKIKFLVSNSLKTKKQIVAEAEENAQQHRMVNQTQEREDGARVDHAVKELREENKVISDTDSHLVTMLAISIFINFIFLAALALAWYLIFYR